MFDVQPHDDAEPVCLAGSSWVPAVCGLMFPQARYVVPTRYPLSGYNWELQVLISIADPCYFRGLNARVDPFRTDFPVHASKIPIWSTVANWTGGGSEGCAGGAETARFRIGLQSQP